MSKSKDLITYYDAITAININQGVVKIMLGNQDAGEIVENSGKALPNQVSTIALPLNQFIYTLSVFLEEPKNQDMIAKMKEARANAETNSAK